MNDKLCSEFGDTADLVQHLLVWWLNCIVINTSTENILFIQSFICLPHTLSLRAPHGNTLNHPPSPEVAHNVAALSSVFFSSSSFSFSRAHSSFGIFISKSISTIRAHGARLSCNIRVVIFVFVVKPKWENSIRHWYSHTNTHTQTRCSLVHSHTVVQKKRKKEKEKQKNKNGSIFNELLAALYASTLLNSA